MKAARAEDDSREMREMREGRRGGGRQSRSRVLLRYARGMLMEVTAVVVLSSAALLLMFVVKVLST